MLNAPIGGDMRGDDVRREWHGATHQLVMHEQTHRVIRSSRMVCRPDTNILSHWDPIYLILGGAETLPVCQEIVNTDRSVTRRRVRCALKKPPTLRRGTPHRLLRPSL